MGRMKTLAFLVALLSGCAAQEPYAESCSHQYEVRWCSCDVYNEWISTRQCLRVSPPEWTDCDCGNARMLGTQRRDVRDAGNRPPF